MGYFFLVKEGKYPSSNQLNNLLQNHINLASVAKREKEGMAIFTLTIRRGNEGGTKFLVYKDTDAVIFSSDKHRPWVWRLPVSTAWLLIFLVPDKLQKSSQNVSTLQRTYRLMQQSSGSEGAKRFIVVWPKVTAGREQELCKEVCMCVSASCIYYTLKVKSRSAIVTACLHHVSQKWAGILIWVVNWYTLQVLESSLNPGHYHL